MTSFIIVVFLHCEIRYYSISDLLVGERDDVSTSGNELNN